MNVAMLEGRPIQYLNDSGLMGLTSGLSFVALGISSLLWPMVARSSHPEAALLVQFSGVICAALVWLGAYQIKRRILFPRGGYVVPRVEPTVRYVRPIMIGLIILIGFLARGRRLTFDLSSALAGPVFALVFAALFGYIAWKGRIRIMAWFAAYMVCLSVAIWLINMGAYAGMSLLQIGAGAPIAIYGAFKLRKYVKVNPVAAG